MPDPAGFQFDQPVFLWLIAAAFPLVIIGVRAMHMGDWLRATTVLLLRVVVIVLMAIILARPRMVQTHDQLTVIGLLDVSGSIKRFADLPRIEELNQQTNLEYMRWWFREATQTRAPDDRFGLIVFDGRAAAISAPRRGDYPESTLDLRILEGTNIAEAIDLGLAMFPADTSKRLILVSDGNETIGNALEAARVAAGQLTDTAGRGLTSGSTTIDVVPIVYNVTRDVQVVRIEGPPLARPDQVVTIRIVVDALEPVSGSLTLLREDVMIDLNGRAPGGSRAVDLPSGRSVHEAQVLLGATPINRFEAVFEPDDPRADRLPENNRAEGFIATPSRGRVLVIRNGNSADDASFALALDAAGLPVDVVPPSQAPRDVLALQGFDLIVLQDIAAYDFEPHMHELLAGYVNDFGGGLLVLGGEHSFGAGGWNGTPLEEVMPLELDLPRELRQSHAALVLVLDKSGSMAASVAGTRSTQQQVANEGAIAAIQSLQPDSQVGVVVFDFTATTRVPLAPNTDPDATASRILSITPSGGTNMGPALRKAQEMLRTANVEKKHVVILTDGQSEGREAPEMIAAEMWAQGITLSTIAVGDEADSETLKRMAEAGNGEFYQVINPAMIPRVLVDSVQVINRPLIKEGTFRPVVLPTGSTLTSGMSGSPPLEGIVLTAARDDPRAIMEMTTPDGEPLLAHWQAGLGRVAAFTSDAHLNWSRNWNTWPGYGTFFVQLARQVARPPVNHNLELTTRIENDRLNITLDAATEDGGHLDKLVVTGVVYDPHGEQTRVRLRQIGPGRYQRSIPAMSSGNYVVALTPQLGETALAPVIGGTNHATGAELRRYRSNVALLKEVAEQTGGRLLDVANPAAVDLFDREDLPISTSFLPAWRPFLWGLIALFLLDVASRRIAWNRSTLQRAWLAATDRVAHAHRKGEIAQATLTELRTRSEQLDAEHDHDAARFDKLATGPPRPAPSATLPNTQAPSEQEIESRRADAIARLKGKTPAQPKPSELPKPNEADTTQDDPTGTTSGLLAAKRRIQERMRDEQEG